MDLEPRLIKAADLQRIGVSKPYAHQLVSGARSPSLKLALQIEATYGVPPTSWPLKVAGSEPGLSGDDHRGEPSVGDADVLAPGDACGAEKANADFSRAGADA